MVTGLARRDGDDLPAEVVIEALAKDAVER